MNLSFKFTNVEYFIQYCLANIQKTTEVVTNNPTKIKQMKIIKVSLYGSTAYVLWIFTDMLEPH